MNYFNLHTHKATNQTDVLELVNQYPKDFDALIPFYSIGIHPWHIDENSIEADLAIILNQLQNKNCLAIGECGLDKRIEIDFDLQISVFEKQLHLAEKFQKPVIVHCVAAFQEVIEIKKKLEITVPMVIHGFSKNEQTAKNLIDNGFYLSFGKYLLQNPALKTVFKTIPNDRFFLETDTTDNSIESVYALAAKYKNVEITELQNIINANFKTVFGAIATI
ncbi:MAG: TatD family hydrolase [Flavobacterium sp.]|nr:TatD family hydrolase [Flavobacterium sp.]